MKLVKRILLITCIAFIMIVGVLGGLGYQEYRKQLHKGTIEEYIEEIQNSSDYIKYDDIAPSLIKATIAIEDKRFYDHHGIDYTGLVHAMGYNMIHFKMERGGSTIAQQVIKNIYYDYTRSPIEKIAESLLALDLEKKYSKEEIIEIYVNIINYGDNHMGIKQASEGYFHKTASELSLDEATLLAGIPQSPMNYQLSNHYKQAKMKQKLVLEAMVKQAMITEQEMSEIINK